VPYVDCRQNKLEGNRAGVRSTPKTVAPGFSRVSGRMKKKKRA
jgi:hypothetical protein